MLRVLDYLEKDAEFLALEDMPEPPAKAPAPEEQPEDPPAKRRRRKRGQETSEQQGRRALGLWGLGIGGFRFWGSLSTSAGLPKEEDNSVMDSDKDRNT